MPRLVVTRILVVLVLAAIMLTTCPTALASDGGRCQVLVVWDTPCRWGDPEYKIIRELVGKIDCSVVGMSAWEIFQGVHGGVDWVSRLRGGGYSLVIVLWSRPGYRKAVETFIAAAVKANVPVLLVPCSCGWSVGQVVGLATDTIQLAGPANLSIAASELTNGVLVSCIPSGCMACCGFRPLNVSWASWRPLVLAPSGVALAAVGLVNGTRVAVVAPYLYSWDCGDNRRLLENIMLWLLGMWPPQERESVAVLDWGSVAVRDLAKVRERLLGELEKLNKTLAKLQEELTELNKTRNMLLKEIQSLEARVGRIEGTSGGEGKGVYWLWTGTAGAVGVAVGYLAAVAVGRRIPGQAHSSRGG